jgi:large subunit ribosomal protein L25
MENTEALKVSTREGSGKGPARQLRMVGQVPGVCYGKSVEPVLVSVDPKELAKRLTGPFGLNALFKLEIEGHEGAPVVRVSQYQRDPVKRTIRHVDFHAIEEGQMVVTRVPLKLEGRPLGVIEGGSLKQIRHDVKVRGPAALIPSEATVDVSGLKIDQTARVSAVQVPEGVEVVFNDDFSVAMVFLSRAARAAMLAAQQAAEGAGEKKKKKK